MDSWYLVPNIAIMSNVDDQNKAAWTRFVSNEVTLHVKMLGFDSKMQGSNLIPPPYFLDQRCFDILPLK